MKFLKSLALVFFVFRCSLDHGLSSAEPAVADVEVYEENRFEVTTVASNLTQPMEMAISDDGDLIFIEIGGLLKRASHLGSGVEVVGQIEVTTAQENGLIGLALDPDFTENGWLYLQYSPPDFEGQRVSRFEFRNEKLDLKSEKILLAYREQRQECCHHAGSIEFDQHGNLYIGTGDNTNPFGSDGFSPIDQREGRSPWDAQRSSANSKSFNGKILRIHPTPDGSYSIPDGNLFSKTVCQVFQKFL